MMNLTFQTTDLTVSLMRMFPSEIEIRNLIVYQTIKDKTQNLLECIKIMKAIQGV